MEKAIWWKCEACGWEGTGILDKDKDFVADGQGGQKRFRAVGCPRCGGVEGQKSSIAAAAGYEL
jgi:predicted RNA-binding Zn-ribbon protein involved in translation (DUF1610 family)